MFQLQLNYAAFKPVERFRLGIHLHTNAGRRFVDQVDSLVRQLTIGDITVRKRCRRHDGRVSDLHVVVQLVTFFQAAQDSDGVFHARLRHIHFLETTFERRILLYILTIFIERSRADAVQLAARQRRFEHVARIHRAIRLTGTNHGVQFVDKQDNAAFLLGGR